MKDLKRHYFYLATLFIVFLFACRQSGNRQVAHFEGHIQNGTGALLKLSELTTSKVIPLDSVILRRDGFFSFSVPLEKSGFYLLGFQNERIPLAAGPGDTLFIKSDTSGFTNDYSVSGNQASRMLNKYFVHTAKNKQVLDSLGKVFLESQHLDDFYKTKLRLDSALDLLVQKQRSFTIKLIRDNPSSFANLLLLNQAFAGEELIDPAKNLDLLLSIDSLLTKKYPDNQHVDYHRRRLNRILDRKKRQDSIKARLEPGQPAPPIVLQDEFGEPRQLSELEGRKVLIFFWASWSPESRAVIQQLKELVQKAGQPEIFAVSLDHNPKFWKAALEMENTPWVNVSDTRGMDSPLAEIFNLPAELPYFYLLDQEGNIIVRSAKLSRIRKAL